MVKNVNIELTKFQVEQLEYFADLLEGFDYSMQDTEIKFLILIVNIESLLPSSNIFDYVFKTDQTKDKKLELQESKKQKFEIVNSNVSLLETLPTEINDKWNQVSDYYEKIKQLETEIEDIHKRMDNLGTENQTLYQEIEQIDFDISDIDNHIEESEWKVDLDSHEEMTFNKVKEKLVIEKRINYGNI